MKEKLWNWIIVIGLAVIILVLGYKALAQTLLFHDANHDGIVDINDFANFTGEWLQPGIPSDHVFITSGRYQAVDTTSVIEHNLGVTPELILIRPCNSNATRLMLNSYIGPVTNGSTLHSMAKDETTFTANQIAGVSTIGQWYDWVAIGWGQDE